MNEVAAEPSFQAAPQFFTSRLIISGGYLSACCLTENIKGDDIEPSFCPAPFRTPLSQTELEREKSRKDGGDSALIERTRQTEAESDWAKEMADRLDRVNQGLSRENSRLKSHFKSQEDDRKFLIKQLVAIKVLDSRVNFTPNVLSTYVCTIRILPVRSSHIGTVRV